jgi:hypothetical protein
MRRKRRNAKGHAAQRQQFCEDPRTSADLTHLMLDGSDLSTVPGLDRIRTQEAEDSGSNRAEFRVDLRVRGRRFTLLLCMSYLLCPISSRSRLADLMIQTGPGMLESNDDKKQHL